MKPMPENSPAEYFRAGVGAMIVDSDTGRILVLRRADVHDEEAWQMPQGGIDAGESPGEALVREVAEEVGLTAADYSIAAEFDDWLTYELPEGFRSAKTGRGQVQKWFLLELRANDAKIEPDGIEFDRTRWVELDELPTLTAEFRRPLYRRLVELARSARSSG